MIYGRLATNCGYTFEQIENCPLPFVFELHEFWNVEPPVHDIARAWIGFKSKKKAELTPIEMSFASGLKTRTFDSLPPQIKNWLKSKKKEETNV